jgi:hypothetical protein
MRFGGEAVRSVVVDKAGRPLELLARTASRDGLFNSPPPVNVL